MFEKVAFFLFHFSRGIAKGKKIVYRVSALHLHLLNNHPVFPYSMNGDSCFTA